MTRVSENSSQTIVHYNLNKNKKRLEDLQLQGSTLKTMVRPSDNPLGHVETLSLRSQINDNRQYIRNANSALLNLNTTEESLRELTNVIIRAKEIAIAQSSDFYNAETRASVAREVKELRLQALKIGNKHLGSRYLFAGFKSLSRPFTPSGEYQGDTGRIRLEVARDFFIPVNLHGKEIFYSAPTGNEEKTQGLLQQLETLNSALRNNHPDLVRSLLEKLDDTLTRLITLRTQVGAIVNSVESSKKTIESEDVDSHIRKSNLEDADVAKLFSDFAQQKNILKASYQTSESAINQTLLDFLKS